MHHLSVLSLRNRALIALITIVAAVFGALALVNLKQELIPSIEFPQLVVVSDYPGASPAVVEHDVSTPIELAIQGVAGLEQTTATSTTDSSIVQAQFTYGTNLATAEQKIELAISRIKQNLPSGVDPNVVSASLDDLPVIQLAVTGYDNARQTQDRLQSIVVPDLQKLDGVNAAQVIGGRAQRITITPDDAKLAAAGFTTQSISQALAQNGLLFPGGTITAGGQTLTVQTGSKLDAASQIAALPLIPSAVPAGAGAPGSAGAAAVPGGAASAARPQGQTAPRPIAQPAPHPTTTIGDVATVTLGQDPVTSISRVNGKDALTIAVTKLPSANTVDVSTAVRDALPSLSKKLDGAHFTVVFDQAPFIQQSIDSLAQEGLLGLLFAVVVILIFLLSVRATLVTAISIPTSVLITFIGLEAFGYSLNILTLGALTIAIGRVVDDSIVVIENIKRHYVRGADKLGAVVTAVREVAAAVAASTLTTVAVFLPVAFVGDVTGELFRPFALTVTIAMLASLFVALTIVPVLAFWFLKPGRPLVDAAGRHIDPQSPAAPPSRLQRGYLPILRWTLHHSWVTVVIAVLVLGGTVALVPHMKTNFLGDSGQNTLTVTQDLGPAASLDAQNTAAQKVEKVLADVHGIDTIQVSIGSSGSALQDAFAGGGSGITYSVTTDPNANQQTIQNDVTAATGRLHDVGRITVGGSTGGGFGSTNVEIDITAPDAPTLQKATDAVVSAVKGRPGVGQVTTNLAASLPYIAVSVNRADAAAHGLSEVAVGQLVSNTMRAQSIGTIAMDDTTVTVYLAAPTVPTTIGALRAMQIPTATGPVRLDSIATVKDATGPASITTQRGIRTSTVTVAPSTDNLTTASASITEALKTAHLPEAATAQIGGVLSQQNTAFSQLGLAMLAAILIVYIIMVATFKSLRQPLLLLVSVPFSATGAILLQIVTGVPLGVASLIGVLMLIGIVVTNAIVLVDLINQYRGHGLRAHQAVIEGSSRRLRPILMTALATIFALTPMALGITGHGGFISQPLAIVVIGGLVSSTALTLLVLPTLYNLVEGARERRQGRRDAAVVRDGAAHGRHASGGADAAVRDARQRLRDAGPDGEGEAAATGARDVVRDGVGADELVSGDGEPLTRRALRDR